MYEFFQCNTLPAHIQVGFADSFARALFPVKYMMVYVEIVSGKVQAVNFIVLQGIQYCCDNIGSITHFTFDGTAAGTGICIAYVSTSRSKSS